MEVTMMEHDAYLELRRRLCGLSVAVTELYRKVAPPTREKAQHAGSMRGAAYLAAGFAELPRSGNHPVFHDRFQILLPGDRRRTRHPRSSDPQIVCRTLLRSDPKSSRN